MPQGAFAGQVAIVTGGAGGIGGATAEGARVVCADRESPPAGALPGSLVGKNAGNARPWLAPGEQAKASNAAYGASKAGVHAITGFPAKELAPHGITVNAVAPGPIATAMTSAFPEALRQLIPVGRMGRLEDVVRAILFLGSRDNGFVTGEVLDVNGGMWCD